MSTHIRFWMKHNSQIVWNSLWDYKYGQATMPSCPRGLVKGSDCWPMWWHNLNVIPLYVVYFVMFMGGDQQQFFRQNFA
jgi:hypothetical protein